VNKILPRGRKVYNLYEWEKSEDLFIEKFHNIKYHHLTNQNIEGVYETKLPLLFRAVMDLGCLIKPRANQIPKHEQALGRVYKMNELEVKTHLPSGGEYLPSTTYEKIFIVHSGSPSRSMWAVFIEASNDISFYIVNANQNKNQNMQKTQNFKHIFNQTLTEID
jgi:DNA polymerase epsilon subunit 1